eukprot:gene21342-28277_t
MQVRISGASTRVATQPSASRVYGRRVSVVPSASKYKGGLVDKVTIGKDGKASGFRYDPSMQRWLMDVRADKAMDTTVTPYAGEAYTVWPVIHYQLKEKNLKGVDPEEKRGWTLVDVRLEGDFYGQHAAGAVNIPLFRVVESNKPWDIVKKIVFAERDPDYTAKALAQVKKNQKIIVMCSIGGTLDTLLRLRPDKKPNGTKDPERNFGRESRSLKACHELIFKGGWDANNLNQSNDVINYSQGGWDANNGGWNANNVRFLEGGFQQWRFQDFDIEYDQE